jgi:hypothetical protein
MGPGRLRRRRGTDYRRGTETQRVRSRRNNNGSRAAAEEEEETIRGGLLD